MQVAGRCGVLRFLCWWRAVVQHLFAKPAAAKMIDDALGHLSSAAFEFDEEDDDDDEEDEDEDEDEEDEDEEEALDANAGYHGLRSLAGHTLPSPPAARVPTISVGTLGTSVGTAVGATVGAADRLVGVGVGTAVGDGDGNHDGTGVCAKYASISWCRGISNLRLDDEDDEEEDEDEDEEDEEDDEDEDELEELVEDSVPYLFGRNYRGHNYKRQNYKGHDYIGHDYMVDDRAVAVWVPKSTRRKFHCCL